MIGQDTKTTDSALVSVCLHSQVIPLNYIEMEQALLSGAFVFRYLRRKKSQFQYGACLELHGDCIEDAMSMQRRWNSSASMNSTS